MAAKASDGMIYCCPTCKTPDSRWSSTGVIVQGVRYCCAGCWGIRLTDKMKSEGNEGRWANTTKKFNQRQRRPTVACPHCATQDTYRTGTGCSPNYEYRRFLCGVCDRNFTQRRERGQGGRWEFTREKQMVLVIGA